MFTQTPVLPCDHRICYTSRSHINHKKTPAKNCVKFCDQDDKPARIETWKPIRTTTCSAYHLINSQHKNSPSTSDVCQTNGMICYDTSTTTLTTYIEGYIVCIQFAVRCGFVLFVPPWNAYESHVWNIRPSVRRPRRRCVELVDNVFCYDMP